MWCTRLAEIQVAKGRKNWPSAHHRTTLSGYIFATNLLRHVSTIGKLLNSSTSSMCPYNMVNFGVLTAEACWRVWDTPANFNGFRVLASLQHPSRWTEVNQTLDDVWPSPGLVHCVLYIHFWGRLLRPNGSLPRSVVVSQTLRRATRNRITELLRLVIVTRGRHLYSEGGRHVGRLVSIMYCCAVMKLLTHAQRSCTILK